MTSLFSHILAVFHFHRPALILAAAGALAFHALPSEAAEVLVVGDTQLKPVVEIISGIRETLGMPFEVLEPGQARGRLRDIVAEQGATVVVALGKDAINEAASLPPSVAVIYDLVIRPPELTRPNTTGFYMATPVKEYLELINRHLPSIRRIAVIGSPELMSVVAAGRHPQVAPYRVKSPVDLVNAVGQCDSADAIVLLPDVSLLTALALEDVYLLSFKKGIPIIGVSEKQVKQGGLLALVFDPMKVGRQIGEKAAEAARGEDLGQGTASPSREFDLFLNLDTARRMNISVSAELFKRARRVFP